MLKVSNCTLQQNYTSVLVTYKVFSVCTFARQSLKINRYVMANEHLMLSQHASM